MDFDRLKQGVGLLPRFVNDAGYEVGRRTVSVCKEGCKCESLRVSRKRVLQRQVLHLGELNTAQLESWQAGTPRLLTRLARLLADRHREVSAQVYAAFGKQRTASG